MKWCSFEKARKPVAQTRSTLPSYDHAVSLPRNYYLKVSTDGAIVRRFREALPVLSTRVILQMPETSSKIFQSRKPVPHNPSLI
jgi:hypothetical protein